jgi:hypothetical protein
MYDHSVIKDNTYVNSNSTAIGFIHIQSGTFEMHGNASITGNKWEPYLSGTDTQIGNRIYVTGYAAVYGTGAISFKMHDNSEISGNEMRAVYLTSSGSNYPSFTMTGGAITNNGKKTWTGSNIEYYVLGGGIYLASGQFEMKGGTIADNGVSDRPGSGIMAYNTSNTTVTTPFILNGSVAITGNPIAFRAVNDTTNRTYPYLGPDFSASIPISVQLILNGSTNNDVNNYATYWKDKQFLIPLTGESTPDISTMANMFVIAGYYWLNTSAMNSADYSEQVNYKIDADGYIRANSDF